LVTSLGQALRRRSGANGEAGPEGAEGRMPGVTKVTRPPGWRTEHHRDVSRFSRNAENQKQMDPSFRWDDKTGGVRRKDDMGGFRQNKKKGTGSRPSPGRRSGEAFTEMTNCEEARQRKEKTIPYRA